MGFGRMYCVNLFMAETEVCFKLVPNLIAFHNIIYYTRLVKLVGTMFKSICIFFIFLKSLTFCCGICVNMDVVSFTAIPRVDCSSLVLLPINHSVLGNSTFKMFSFKCTNVRHMMLHSPHAVTYRIMHNIDMIQYVVSHCHDTYNYFFWLFLRDRFITGICENAHEYGQLLVLFLRARLSLAICIIGNCVVRSTYAGCIN